MISDDRILEHCDEFLAATSERRQTMSQAIIENAQKEAYQNFAARIVILLYRQNRIGDAELVVNSLLNYPPFEEQACWELGYGFGVSGQPNQSIQYLIRAIDLNPDVSRLLWLSVQYAIIKDAPKLKALLLRIERDYPDHSKELAIHREFFDLLQKYDRAAATELMKQIYDRFATRTIPKLEDDIRTALDAQRPYLLLRLGDGEGACIRLHDEDEASNKNYYRANRDEFADIWFKDTSVLDDDSFIKTLDTFNAIIGQADALGGSMYSAAIQTEYDYASRRGIAWVVNVMRKLLACADDNPRWAEHTPVFSLSVHYDLLLSGALARLLKGRRFVGLISCQNALPAALRRTYGIDHIEFIKTPGEQIHAVTLGSEAVSGRHWPDRFDQIIAGLDAPVDRKGQLWLVAAGILGKIYAAKLKSQGAVVIDIGAVADLWMGKITRTFPRLPPEVQLDHYADSFTLVDVGGLGGLGEEWLPHLSNIRAVLFEPNPSEAAFAREKLRSCRDAIVVERGLGNKSEKRALYVTKILGCSSLLHPNYNFLKGYTIAQAFHVTHEIEVECTRFDTLLANGEVTQPDAVKIDVQGFEYQVLEGFGDALNGCLGVKIEAHLRPIYHEQKLLHDLIDLMSRAGLGLRRLEPVEHFDGDIVEVDAWFTCSPERIQTLSTERMRKLAFLEKVWGLPPRRNSFGKDQFA